MNTKEYNLNDRYWVVITHQEGRVSVDFIVYTIIGTDSTGQILFQESMATSRPTIVESTDNAEVCLQGSIKWDGCSDIHFYPQDEGYNHFCGMRDAKQLGLLLESIYKNSAKLLGVEDDDDLYY